MVDRGLALKRLSPHILHQTLKRLLLHGFLHPAGFVTNPIPSTAIVAISLNRSYTRQIPRHLLVTPFEQFFHLLVGFLYPLNLGGGAAGGDERLDLRADRLEFLDRFRSNWDCLFVRGFHRGVRNVPGIFKQLGHLTSYRVKALPHDGGHGRLLRRVFPQRMLKNLRVFFEDDVVTSGQTARAGNRRFAICTQRRSERKIPSCARSALSATSASATVASTGICSTSCWSSSSSAKVMGAGECDGVCMSMAAKFPSSLTYPGSYRSINRSNTA